MFRHIVVAFDGADRAQDALALALRLRDPDDGHITLACALVERPHWRREPPDDVPEEVGIMLAAARARIPAGIHVALRAPVASSPAGALTELAEDEHADLVVVASSRRTSDGRIHLERTAGRLLQGAPCAVAVAPSELHTDEPFRHVGIAFDGSPEAHVALDAGYAIAAASGAAVTIFHSQFVPVDGGDGPAIRTRLRAQQLLDEAADAAPDGVNPRTLLLPGAAGAQISRASEGIVDLMVCGSRGYGPIQRALVGSVAEDLLEGATHPVLVLPRKAAPALPESTHEPVAMEA
jgi:nucleotide-binding universal stress UspA family protein